MVGTSTRLTTRLGASTPACSLGRPDRRVRPMRASIATAMETASGRSWDQRRSPSSDGITEFGVQAAARDSPPETISRNWSSVHVIVDVKLGEGRLDQILRGEPRRVD